MHLDEENDQVNEIEKLKLEHEKVTKDLENALTEARMASSNALFARTIAFSDFD